ncbi:DUF4870 domain-containing protein [Humibacter ginsenosidimutans]|uniref:DUF4870 domain-containing protein n=1 Tax=Humibacter ginsenosidimutans TaxID=2599293 RepID=A0A5B8LZM8_9MICO|nr:DUF4870 domain-containing protein [Humibacter ginsenosidimutans]QDZ13968.1 DUF4870 domain-containing protein [Humibacter ginsenosidimutans]
MSNVPPPPPPPQNPPQQQYGAPQGYPDGGFSNLQVNLWLSVFFSWIPALIYYLVDKDKTADPIRKANVDNFNFQLIRVIVIVATYILAVIPFIGWILALILWLGSIALFVIAIVHAIQIPNAIRQGREAKYIFTVNWVK